MAAGMAVNSDARLWGLYKELEQTVNAAIHKKFPDAAHDLELALRKHKPDFVSLLKNPVKFSLFTKFNFDIKAKNTLYRDAVKKATTEGLPVQGEQARQTFSQQFIDEALIISDLFDMSEIAAVELLMAGERKQAEFPGLTRGLVAVLLYYDGQRSLVNSLRTLLQSREGRLWTMELSPELSKLVNQYTDQLINRDGLINKILDLISSMDVTKEMDKLQRERAIGPPKHKKQLSDIYKEIKVILADCLFCLVSQQPLSKADTLRLLAHLRADNTLSADGSLELETLCLLMTVLYCFDVSVLEEGGGAESVRDLPLMSENGYITDIHKELTSSTPWANPGLKAVIQFCWALTLRQLSQYEAPSPDVTDVCEEDELVMNMALEANIFHFLRNSVIAVSNFHQEEYYVRKVHGLITDFIHIMPLKVKELKTRGDETARIASAQTQEGIEMLITPSHSFEYLLLLIGDLYAKDPLGLNLCLEFWCPQDNSSLLESAYHSKTPQRQVELYKFVRLSGDCLLPMLFVPYVQFLTGLSSNHIAAHHCFDLLKTNGAGGSANRVSWNHFFTSLNQYYSSLRYERPTGGDTTHGVHRAPMVRGISQIELDGLLSVLKLTRAIAEQNENCRVALYENQQWSAVMLMFGLVTCSIPPQLKAELFLALAAFAKSPDLAANLWPSLEGSQILPTVRSTGAVPGGGIQVELEEIESRMEEYRMTRAFLTLLHAMTDIPVPAGLGAGTRAPGFQPYQEFIINDMFLKAYARAYKDPSEKWQVAVCALEILSKLLREHEIVAEDFVDELVELQGGSVVPINKSPGHILLIYMLKDSGLLKMVLRILDESIDKLEAYTPIHGKESLERVSLLCLHMIEYTLDKADQFIDAVRDTGSPLVVFPMDRLLLGINPRSGKADHLLNIAKYIEFGSLLPDHALSSMKILYAVCRSAPVQTALVNLFTTEETTRLELLHGFVECLEVDDPEVPTDKAIYMPEEKEEVTTTQVHSWTREYLLEILLLSLDQPAPNLAHFLLGFELRKPVSKTNLQDPGILRSPKTCLHAILTILMNGVGTHKGPTCLIETPRLAELCYKLIYLLAANKDTSAPMLRYLRTSRDFLYRQLHHLPFRKQQYRAPVISHQSWLLKVIAIELRLTSLNRQRSHTQRLMRLLLDDSTSDQSSTVVHPGGIDDTESTFDRFGESTVYGQSFLSSTRGPIKGKQTRRKLLCILDSVDITQRYPPTMQLEFFEPQMIEQVIREVETKLENDVVYCDVKLLHRVLMNELNNYQGTIMAAQKVRMIEEVEKILQYVVLRNKVRQELFVKQQSFDAWRQVTEILLNACPEDLLPGEIRQTILFELLQELLQKVADEDALMELTSPVSGVILTLMTNLRQCFLSEPGASDDTASRYTDLLDATATPTQTVPWGQKTGSRTLFATSLKLVLQGLIDHILKSSGGQQRVRANLYGALLYYLQISQRPDTSSEDLNPGEQLEGVAKRVLSDADTEYDQLIRENVNTILTYGDAFMDTVCRDACDGHDVGRMLALSVLDMILSMDKFQQWLTFMSSKGYLQHLIDSILHEDQQLQTLMEANPELRILYIYESKMGLLIRVAESTVGAHTLLQSGILQRLASCVFFDMRPNFERSVEGPVLAYPEEEFIPSPMARYRQLLFAALKLCQALMTSLGVENQDAGNQVLQFLFAHSEVIYHVLSDRQHFTMNLQALKELALVTAVIALANSRDITDYTEDEVEFDRFKNKIEMQMIALLPKYCMSEKLNKQLKALQSQSVTEGRDIRAELSLVYQEVAANVTSFCRTIISASGSSAQYSRKLFRPSLEEALARDLRAAEDFTVASLGTSQAPSLGVVVYQLRQCASHFMTVYDTHQQHLRKLQSLADLSTEDLKEFSGVDEKMTSHQRQKLAKKRLTQIVKYKSKELLQYSYIIENCLFILWRHLEHYLIHCVPVRQASSFYDSGVKRSQQIRRLQELTGAMTVPREDTSLSHALELDKSQVTKEELDAFKHNAPSVINESLLKKLQEINQSFCKSRTHYSFMEAVIRRIKRLLRLHTGS